MLTSPPRRIVVDDSDLRIVYSNNFFVDKTGSQNSKGNFGDALGSTLHGTNSNGSLQFAFSGTQMFVFGTIDQETSPSGHVDPTGECFIDNVSIGQTSQFQFPENNWLLCSSENLTDTSHVLTVKANSHGRTFWFDYLQYTPAENASLENAMIYVDHMDPAISYDSGWQALGNTANMTFARGSIVVFDFIGLSLQWYSLVPTELPHSPSLATYSIDGGLDTGVSLRGLPSSSVSEFNQLIFQTPTLAYGFHTITVTFQSNSNSTPLTLAYLLVQNGTQPLGGFPTTSSTPTAPSSSSLPGTGALKRSNLNVGSIVGGVLGTLFFLFSVIAAYLLFIRHKRKRDNDPKVRNTIPIPFPSRPRLDLHDSERNSASSLRSLNQPINEQLEQPPSSHRRRHSHSKQKHTAPQPSASAHMATPNRMEQIDENTPYYGGYQTWGQTKAIEAKSHKQRLRDSYM